MRKTIYKYQVGDIITNVKSGKLKILEQIRIPHHRKNKNDTYDKGYKYKCLICGNEDSITEGNLNQHQGCNVCSNEKILVGYNDLWSTSPELAKLLADPNDGYKYMQNSHKKVGWKCPNCGNIIKNKQISVINKNSFNCPKCGDGISYPEKFIFNVLQQLLNDNFENEKVFKWSNNRRYDFYFKLNKESYLLEAHGLQHYRETFKSCGGRTLQEEQLNDKLKKELAIKNGIKEDNYIVVDCRESTLEWIKEHILDSKLNNLFDLSKIDWLKCHEYACSSLIKQVCDLWNNNIKNTTKIGKIFKLDQTTIERYLKQGIELKWCDYNPKKRTKEMKENNGKIHRKQIINITTFKVFNSIKEASEYYNINYSHIGDCCSRRRKMTGGYKWMYYKDYLKNT